VIRYATGSRPTRAKQHSAPRSTKAAGSGAGVGAFEVANSTVISRSADRAPPPYSAHQTRGQVSHSGQRVRVQVPPPTPYSLHSQVAPDSARQVRAQAGQPSLLVSELRGNEAAPRARYRARRMLPQVRPAAAAGAEASTAGGGEERYQPRGATNSQRIAQYRAWVAMLRAAPGVVPAHGRRHRPTAGKTEITWRRLTSR
jgi:type IV secretory pathway VirB10-like protein